MGIRAVVPIAVLASGALLSSCSSTTNNPIEPSGLSDNTQAVPVGSLLADLRITSVGVSDSGQDAFGQWGYDARVYLHETNGLDVTVTSIQVQILAGATVVGTASVAPMLWIPANSSRDATLVLASDTHVQLSAITANVKVAFKDMKGNTSSITCTFSCFGCWDY